VSRTNRNQSKASRGTRRSPPQPTGVANRDAIAKLQQESGLPVTGRESLRTTAVLEEQKAALGGDQFVIEGRARAPDGYPATEVTLVMYQLHLGGETTEVGHTTTNGDGYFTLPLSASVDEMPTIQLRTLAGEKEVPVSDWEPLRLRRITIDVTVPHEAQKLAPEHERLLRSLPTGIDLTRLVESADRRDLSLLADQTRWDPRLLAMASTAETMGRAHEVPPAAFYALFRAGLPPDPERLARVPLDTVAAQVKAAHDAGVVHLPDKLALEAVTSFALFAARMRLQTRGTGVSTPAEVIGTAPLAKEGRATLELIYASHASNPATFWSAVDEQLPGARAKLEAHGRLAYLTSNNARLVDRVQRRLAGKPLRSLVGLGYHQPGA